MPIFMLRRAALLAATLFALTALASTGQADGSHVLADVQKRGTIRVATLAGNPPYSSFRPDGQPDGYDVDIARALATALKVKPEFVLVDSPGRITSLQTGKADVAVASFTNTVERSTAIAFTRPYLIVGSIFMVRKDSPIQTLDQLNAAGMKIGAPRGGTAEAVAAEVAPKAEVVRFDSPNDAFLALRSGQINAHLQDSLQNALLISKESASFRNLAGNYSYEEICIGLPAGDFDWFRIIDTFVRQFNGSGENAKLFKKHFGFDMPPLP
jgi:polar amino acid transport system substrate-binding protein